MHSTCVDHKINKHLFTLVENQKMGIGKIVRQLRKERGWKLEELSRRSGVAVGTISAIEVRDSVRSEYASQLAHGLGVSVETLLGTPGLPALAGGSAGPVSPALGIEAIANALALMTDEQREAMAGKLASLARAPDSPTLKKSISESLGSAPLPPAPTT